MVVRIDDARPGRGALRERLAAQCKPGARGANQAKKLTTRPATSLVILSARAEDSRRGEERRISPRFKDGS